MTQQEHEMMLLMFVRTRQMFRILAEALTSRGILTGDDATAFSHAIHFDDEKVLAMVVATWRDYQSTALLSGVVTGLESQPPAAPKS